MRSCHPYAFKSGEWGQIVGERERDGRQVWMIMWPDGATDEWAVVDPQANYEFSEEPMATDPKLEPVRLQPWKVELDTRPPNPSECPQCVAERPALRALLIESGVEDRELIERTVMKAKCRDHRRPAGITGHIGGPEA